MVDYKDGYYIYDTDWQQIYGTLKGYGILPGVGGECSCSVQLSTNIVDYLSGNVNTSEGVYTIGSGSVTLSSLQDTYEPRKVAVYVDATDGLVKATEGLAGTPSSDATEFRSIRYPAPPDYSGVFDLDEGDVILSEVWLKKSGETLLSTDISDRRFFISNFSGQGDKVINALDMPGIPYTAAQIHAAIEALPFVLDITEYHHVGRVYIPEGYWSMDGTPLGAGYYCGGLTHVELLGAGMDKTFLSWEGETTAANGINIGFSADLDTHVVIRDMTLIGDDDKVGRAISVAGVCRYFTIDRVHISHWKGNGIFINGYYSPEVGTSHSITIRDTNIDHCQVGVNIQGGGGDVRIVLLERVHAEYCDMGAYGAGFSFGSVLNGKLICCTSEYVTQEGFSFGGCRQITLDNCYVEGVGIGYHFMGNGSQIDLNNCFGYGNATSLLIADTFSSDFHKNRFINSGTCKMTGMVPGCRAWNNGNDGNTWDFTGLTSPSGEPTSVEELNPPGAGAPGKIVRGGAVVGQQVSAVGSLPTLVTDGQACVWRDTTNNKTYLVGRIENTNYKVELPTGWMIRTLGFKYNIKNTITNKISLKYNVE